MKNYDLESMILERSDYSYFGTNQTINLNVFLVAHTHIDPGWLLTID